MASFLPRACGVGMVPAGGVHVLGGNEGKVLGSLRHYSSRLCTETCDHGVDLALLVGR